MALKDKLVTLEDLKIVHDEAVDLKSAFNNVVIEHIPVNLLNPENIQTGHFYKTTLVDGRSVIDMGDDSTYTCAWIPVEHGKSYTVTGTSYNSYNADDDGYAIGIAASSGGGASVTFDTTATNNNYGNTDKTTTRVYFSWKHATNPVASYMANEGTTLKTYEAYFDPWSELSENVVIPGLDDMQEELQGEIDDIVQMVGSKNLLNPENIQTGHFYKKIEVDGRGVIYMDDNSDYSCAWIPVEHGKSYTVTGTSYNSFNADDDGYAIGIAASSGSGDPVTFDTTVRNSGYNNPDKTTTRVYFSWRHASYPVASYMANEGTTLKTYEPYTEPRKTLADDITVLAESIEPLITPDTYTVDINGDGDYTSFSACLVDLKDDDREKIIYIKPGVYDVFEEIGGATFAAQVEAERQQDPDHYNWFDCSTVVPPHTKIIGIGEVVLEFKPEASEITTQVMSLLSPVNVIYDIYMENITIDCDNCRYGIHDETGHIDGVIGTRHIYKNVNIRKLSTSGGMDPAFGCGMQKSQYMEFDCCNFYSKDRPFSFHNKGTAAGDYTDGTIIVIKNCVSNPYSSSNDRSAIQLRNVNGKQVKIDVRVFNSYLDGMVWIRNETSTERPNAYNLTLVGCGKPRIDITTATNIYTPVIYDELETYFPDAKTLVLASSTNGSTKKYEITVTDGGTISATEITG